RGIPPLGRLASRCHSVVGDLAKEPPQLQAHRQRPHDQTGTTRSCSICHWSNRSDVSRTRSLFLSIRGPRKTLRFGLLQINASSLPKFGTSPPCDLDLPLAGQLVHDRSIQLSETALATVQ